MSDSFLFYRLAKLKSLSRYTLRINSVDPEKGRPRKKLMLGITRLIFFCFIA
jgi:hypothetical protein